MINSLILLFFLTLQQRNKVGTLMNLIIFTFIEKLKKSIWRIFFFRYALSASKSLICHNQPSFKLGQFVWSQTFPTVCIFSIIRFKSHDFSIFKKYIYIKLPQSIQVNTRNKLRQILFLQHQDAHEVTLNRQHSG